MKTDCVFCVLLEFCIYTVPGCLNLRAITQHIDVLLAVIRKTMAYGIGRNIALLVWKINRAEFL